MKGTFYHFASTLPIGMNPLANMDGDLNIWNLSPHPSDDVWTFVGGVASVVACARSLVEIDQTSFTLGIRTDLEATILAIFLAADFRV